MNNSTTPDPSDRPQRRHMGRWAALGVAAVLLMGGGGYALLADADGSTGDPVNSTSPASLQCDDIWQAGKTLPTDFDGCYDGDDVGAVGVYDCQDGAEYAYYDDLGAAYGEEIVKVADFSQVCVGHGGQK